ncbi:cysteine hydrolase family protein [Pelagibius sp. Alg239-R121]|uniref:cysteine hydrolase family protein n=1 Tax=Pelagibius sp. Alg239-R121 TaxID=2993448 RepID=UPI0024A78BC4|nr:cysteine hydrolase family protein [Pelagibius sp. Alg239-R121]
MKTALLVIDVQMAFVHDDAEGTARSCREAEENVAVLLAAFRQRGDKVVHIHHHALDPNDPFNADAPGSAVQPFAEPAEGEAVVVKHVSSGFVGTSLESDLREAGIERLVLCGATANHCVESTTRSAGNLGFDTYYASDAVWAYGATGPDGVRHEAEQVHSMTLSNLEGEFATVLPAAQILAL